MLHDLGLDRYYKLRDEMGEAGQPRDASATTDTYTYLDHALIQEKAISHDERSGHARVVFSLTGVHCTACVWVIEKLPDFLPGVEQSRLNFRTGRVEIDFDPARISLSRLAFQLHQLGYPPRLVAHDELNVQKRETEAQAKDQWMRMGVAAFCAMNLMMVAVSIWEGIYSGIAASYQSFFGWISVVLALPAVTYSAWPFYRRAWQGIRAGVIHMDLPIAAAIVATFLVSTFNAYRGKNDLYFDSLAALVFLLLLGRYAQWRAMQRAREWMSRGTTFLPESVLDETEKARPRAAFQVGDRVKVLAGQRIAFDGTILEGSSSVDLALLTGESSTTRVMPGDRVLAGSLNWNAPILMRVDALGKDTRMGQMEALLASQNELSAHTPFLLWLDRVGRIFFYAICILSVLTMGLGSVYIGWERALQRVLALWIVSCPCALSLATPLALAMAVGSAARRGLLLRTSDVLEHALSIRHVLFDKTGTLTRGELRVVKADWNSSFFTEDAAADDAAQAKTATLVAALEEGIAHPVANAVRAWARQYVSDGDLPTIATEVLPGKGVRSRDRKYWLGSVSWLTQEFGFKSIESGTTLGFVEEGKWKLGLVLQDEMRPEAAEVIAALKRNHLNVGLLSGDRMGVVLETGKLLGISSPLLGEQLPEHKLRTIEHLRRSGAVMMVGDGINDTGAIARADIGVAIVPENANLLHTTAPVVLGRADLRLVPALFELSRDTRSVIRRSLVVSLAYNLVGTSAALLGWINPFLAGLLMPISSVTVVILTLSARAWRK